MVPGVPNFRGLETRCSELFSLSCDGLCPGDAYELSTIARTRKSWGTFRQLLPFFSSSTISLA